MQSRLTKAFFKAFSDHFNDDEAAFDTQDPDIASARYEVLYFTVSTIILNVFLATLADVLKKHIADKQPSAKKTSALYYMHKKAVDETLKGETALLADIQAIRKDTTENVEQKLDAKVRHVTLRASVEALMMKLKTTPVLEEAEQKEVNATPYAVIGKAGSYSALNDKPVVHNPATTEVIAIFGQYVLDQLTEMRNVSNDAMLELNDSLPAAVMAYSREMTGRFTVKAAELAPKQDKKCLTM